VDPFRSIARRHISTCSLCAVHNFLRHCFSQQGFNQFIKLIIKTRMGYLQLRRSVLFFWRFSVCCYCLDRENWVNSGALRQLPFCTIYIGSIPAGGRSRDSQTSPNIGARQLELISHIWIILYDFICTYSDCARFWVCKSCTKLWRFATFVLRCFLLFFDFRVRFGLKYIWN